MTTMTAPTFPADRLLTCAKCGSEITLSREPEPRYACANACITPFRAKELNRLLITDITAVVINDATFPMLKASFIEGMRETAGHDPGNPPTDDVIRRYANDPDTFMRESNAALAAETMAMFIERVELETERATIQYALALPEGSNLAGSRRQEIELPSWVTM